MCPGSGGAGAGLLPAASAGAINVVLLAAAADPAAATQVMVRLWESTGTGDVVAGLRGTAIRNLTSYLAGQLGHGQMTSLLDTAPLRRTMDTRLDWQQLRDRLDSGEGWAHGAAVVTTSASSGRTTVFLQGQGLTTPPPDDVRGIDYVPAALAAPHVMASAAIPVLFPPVRIGQPARDNVFTDGGVRLNAPIKPALALGADRVIVVATTPDPDTFAPPATPAVPDVFGAAGIVLRSLLQDRMAEDIRTLRKTNRFVAAGQDAGAPPLARPGTGEPYRLIPHLFLGPPRAGIISAAADEFFARQYGSLPGRLSDLGIPGTLLGRPGTGSHGELLSFILFDPGFHAALVRLGSKHAGDALGPGPDLPWRY